MKDLTRWRDEFPVLSRSVYMISHALGAMPRRPPTTSPNTPRSGPGEACAAGRIGGGRCRWRSATGSRRSSARRRARSACTRTSRRRTWWRFVPPAVRVAHAHRLFRDGLPVDGPLYRAQQAAGFTLHVVPAEPDLTVHTERMLEAIDETTAAVAFSHVLFRTSYIMDAAAITQRARAVGAAVILDTYQSAGIIPVDVDCARRGLRGRRLPQMAVRRSRQRVPLHATRSAEGGAAIVHGMAGARG